MCNAISDLSVKTRHPRNTKLSLPLFHLKKEIDEDFDDSFACARTCFGSLQWPFLKWTQPSEEEWDITSPLKYTKLKGCELPTTLTLNYPQNIYNNEEEDEKTELKMIPPKLAPLACTKVVFEILEISGLQAPWKKKTVERWLGVHKNAFFSRQKTQEDPLEIVRKPTRFYQ